MLRVLLASMCTLARESCTGKPAVSNDIIGSLTARCTILEVTHGLKLALWP